MAFTIKIDRKLREALNPKGSKNIPALIRKEFSKTAPIRIKRTIIQDIIKGISPVFGKGKWTKYSKAYKEVIRNKAAYRTINGKVVRFTDKKLVKKLNADYHAKASPSKKISPVNLRHSGGLHRSFKVFTKGGFRRRFRMVFRFNDKLADIHNRRGAGKSKVVRRLLPDKQGERFNRTIEKKILSELRKAVDTIAKQFN